MGNYKFRFSDMMPNAWFYKLKDMSSSSNNKRASRNQKNNTKKNNQSNASAILQSPKQSKLQNLSHARKSYYFNRDPIANFDTFYNSLSNPENQSQFHHDPPKKSASSKHVVKIKSRKSLLVSKQLISNSSVSGGCKCDSSNVSSPRNSFSATENSFPVKIDSRSDESLATKSSSCARKSNSDEKDIIIDLKIEKEFDLAPIITSKPPKPKQQQQQITVTHNTRASTKTGQEPTMRKTHAMKSYSPAGGMKLRTKSPRIANLNINGGRKSVSSSTSTSSGSRRSNISDSFAVVKSSYNPHKDFKESMMEMIVENNIRASKDLEELLACYLSLNSDEYHDLIIKVFKQIWFDLVDMQIKNK